MRNTEIRPPTTHTISLVAETRLTLNTVMKTSRDSPAGRCAWTGGQPPEFAKNIEAEAEGSGVGVRLCGRSVPARNAFTFNPWTIPDWEALIAHQKVKTERGTEQEGKSDMMVIHVSGFSISPLRRPLEMQRLGGATFSKMHLVICRDFTNLTHPPVQHSYTICKCMAAGHPWMDPRREY